MCCKLFQLYGDGAIDQMKKWPLDPLTDIRLEGNYALHSSVFQYCSVITRGFEFTMVRQNF